MRGPAGPSLQAGAPAGRRGPRGPRLRARGRRFPSHADQRSDPMARHSFRFGSALLALVAGLGLAMAAAAQVTVPHKEHCRGTLTNVLPPGPDGVGTLFFAGEGRATHF